MAYPTYQARAEGIDARTVEYGYGMDDIQRASERLDRSSALEGFQLSQQFKDTLRRIPGAFNQRGMLDSGQHKRARERAYAAPARAGRRQWIDGRGCRCPGSRVYLHRVARADC